MPDYEFHDLEIGQFFVFVNLKQTKLLLHNGPFIKNGYFSFSFISEYAESSGIVHQGNWHDPVKILSKEEALQEFSNHVLSTVLK
jgi:hypothetical protein